MFSFFTKNIDRDNINYPIVKFTQFDYIRNRYRQELDRIKSYYNNSDKAIYNNHILVKLINMLEPANRDDIFAYMDIVTTNAKYVSKQFNITSNINYGTSFENIFYKENAIELFLYKENSYNIATFDTEWKSYRALKCIYSEDTDIDFYIPTGKKSLPYPMLFVYEIDLAILLGQYRCWCLERLENNRSTNPAVFVYTYILPDLMESLLDFSIFNRFITISNGLIPTKYSNIHPFNILNYSNIIDTILTKVYENVNNTSKHIVQILKSIPCIVKENANELLRLSSAYITVQNEWVYWLNRIFIIENILNILGEKGINANKNIVTSLKYDIKRIMSRPLEIENKVPDTIAMRYFVTIENIKRHLDIK